jgi:hypothetical protein
MDNKNDMAVKESRTVRVLNKMKLFIESQQKDAEKKGMREYWLRDINEIDNARRKLSESENDGLNYLRDEFKGYLIYLGSYSNRYDSVVKLLDLLYEAMMLDIVDIRSRKQF